MKIVVGLGNPGREYVGTRHNVGWEVLDRLARRLGWTRRDDEFDRLARSKFDGLAMDGPAGQERLLLLKPTTFMNLSGRAVQAAVSFFQLTSKDCLVVLDDVALPTGRLRLRGSGSSGGHNGLKDVERALGTDAYPRLRIGVDAPPPRVPQRDYVLGKFTDAQRQTLDPAVERACDAVLTWADKGLDAAMNKYNVAEETKK
jgi:PTH1 family peptidyl-tRNA hydrolase